MVTGGRKKQYIVGAALMLMVAAFILTVFSLLNYTDKGDLYLRDSQEERWGWRYELLTDSGAQAYEPVFENDYVLALPAGTQAVRITRTMTEDIPSAELEWESYSTGEEVFLDGVLLHSDFPQARRDADGFVHPGREDWERLARRQGDIWQRVRMSLPEDYLGGELTMITYFSEETGVLTLHSPIKRGQ